MCILCELIPKLPRLQFLGLQENPALGVPGAEEIARTLLRPRVQAVAAPSQHTADQDVPEMPQASAAGGGVCELPQGLSIAVGNGVIPVQGIQEGTLVELLFPGKELGSFGV
jgi:hypothetical protein